MGAPKLHAVLLVLAGMCWSSALPADDQRPRVSTPLTTAADNFQQSSATEGPIMGVWRAVTGTAPTSSAPQPLPTAAEKKAKPKPLTLREYLNQQQPSAPEQPVNQQPVTATDDPLSKPPNDTSQSGGTLLELGF